MAHRRAGLFLDLDGTLADSLSVMRIVYDQFLVHFDRVGSDSEFDSLNGPPLSTVIAELARVHGLSPPAGQMLTLYEGMVNDAYRNVAPCHGAIALLRVARQGGIRVGIVTSNSASLAWAWLRRVSLSELVDVVIGGDDVRRGKPDPEPYLVALERTGCNQSASIAVEDSCAGAQSAVAAGIPTFLLAGTNVEAPPTVVVVDNLESVAKIIESRTSLC
jgi:HAD superfamily hydrolase (TIGR01509 family)